MNNPKVEHRLTFLEKQFLAMGAHLEGLQEDLTLNVEVIREDIEKLDQGVKSSYLQIGDTFQNMGNDIKKGLAELKAAHDARFDKIEATQEQILKLLQQKSGE